MPSWFWSALTGVGLFTLLLIFFWPIVTGSAFFWEDFAERIYPFRLFTAVEMSEGRIPFWNPYLFAGIPFLAMIDNAVLYPLTWTLIPLVENKSLSFLAVEWHTLTHILIYGIGLFLLCRKLELSPAARFAAGVAGMFSGAIIHHTHHGEMLHTAVWLPFIFLFLSQAFDRLSYFSAVASGMFWGLAILAGHPQIFLYIAGSMGFYFLFCLVSKFRADGAGRSLLHLTGCFGVALGLGLGIGSVGFLPALELSKYSLRSDTTYELVKSYAIDPRQLFTLLMPDFFGSASSTDVTYWGPGREEYGHYWETYIYVGILPLILAGAALYLSRKPFTLFLGLLAGGSLLTALGDATPVFRLAYEIVPGFDRLRAHGRLAFIIGFALCVLAAIGLDAVQNAWRHKETSDRLKRYIYVLSGFSLILLVLSTLFPDTLVALLNDQPDFHTMGLESLSSRAPGFFLLIIASIAFLIACQRWPSRPVYLSAAALLLIFIDLYGAGHTFSLSPLGPDTYFPENDIVKRLKAIQQAEGGRISVRSGRYMLLKRNAGAIFQIHTLEGLTSPLRLAHTLPPGAALELMNVKYHLRVDESNRMNLVPTPGTMPPAFIVRKYTITPDLDTVTKTMQDSTFAFRTMATLDKAPDIPIPPDAEIVEQPAVTVYESQNMTISVTMNAPGLLVVGEVYYPAWRAYVDGRPVPVYRANHTMRAVALSAGSHTVEFQYESEPFQYGALLSIFCVAIGLATGVFYWRRRK